MRNVLMRIWMDLCNTAKNALLQTKESTQELYSIIRRRCNGEMVLTSEFNKFSSLSKSGEEGPPQGPAQQVLLQTL